MPESPMRNWTREIVDALGAAGQDADADIVEELAQHAAAAYEAARADGLAADAAADHVNGLIGEWVRRAPALRRRRGGRASVEPPSSGRSNVTGVVQDLRYAIRLIRRTPGPAIVSAMTMALGIAAATILFSITWGVLMKPLPWPDAARLVRVEERRQGATRQLEGIFTNGPYLAWAEAPATVEALAAYRPRTATLTGAGDPQRIRVTATTASLFSLLGTAPERGALFTAADETANVAVLSYGLWQRAFGGRADMVGRSVSFDGTAYTVVGIAARDFAFPDAETEAWLPMRVRPTKTASGGSWIQIFSAIGRLKESATAAQAAEEGTARARSAPDGGLAAMAVFGTRTPADIVVRPMLDAMTAAVKAPLLVLLFAVGLLLATATANIAGVQLARATTRRREMAVRAAIGADGGRLARQLITEALVTGLAGGTLGLLLAAAIHRVLPAILPAGFPRLDAIAIDWRVAGFSFAMALAASIAATLAPAVQARRLNLVEAIAEDPTASGGGFGRARVARIRAVIMAGQVAAACVLLVGASLLTRTFFAMLRADRGFEAANVLTAHVATPGNLFTTQRRAQLVTTMLDRLRARDDIVAAGMSTSVPLLPADAVMAFTLPPPPGRDQPVEVQCSYRMISPGYLEAMGIRVLQGRAFDARDTSTSAPVLLVNQAFAKKYLPRDAVGRRIPAALIDGKPDWEIAGIIDDVTMGPDLTGAAQPEILVSYLQFDDGLRGDPIVAVRTRRDPAPIAPMFRQLLPELDPSASLESVMTMEDRISTSLANPRLYAVVLGGFGMFALIIAGVGLFAVLSYGVAQRSKELGIRAALGATPASITRLVVRDGMTISITGAALGMAMAAAAGRWLSAFLYGVRLSDPVTFTVVPAVLLVAAAAACLVPALRAARIDPLRVLKGGD
jgi:predicted permease